MVAYIAEMSSFAYCVFVCCCLQFWMNHILWMFATLSLLAKFGEDLFAL